MGEEEFCIVTVWQNYEDNIVQIDSVMTLMRVGVNRASWASAVTTNLAQRALLTIGSTPVYRAN
jgi:hypothetical protein